MFNVEEFWFASSQRKRAREKRAKRCKPSHPGRRHLLHLPPGDPSQFTCGQKHSSSVEADTERVWGLSCCCSRRSGEQLAVVVSPHWWPLLYFLSSPSFSRSFPLFSQQNRIHQNHRIFILKTACKILEPFHLLWHPLIITFNVLEMKAVDSTNGSKFWHFGHCFKTFIWNASIIICAHFAI